MRWADVDLDAATWSRKAVDLKQGRDHALPLSAPAIAILSAIRDEQSGNGKRALGEWVFPSAASKSKHLVAIRRLWRNVVKTAELGDLRLHDIRHTVASQLVSSGASLALVGSLLGHSSPQITARYAHLIDTVEREAVGKIGAWVEAAGGAPTPPEPPPSGDVIKFPRPRRDPS